MAHIDGAQRLALEATRLLLDDGLVSDPERRGIILGQPSGLETLARRTLKIRAPEVADALGLDVLPEEVRTRLDALRQGGDLPQRARAHQPRRTLSYVVDVFSGVEAYDSARRAEAIEPDTERTASTVPQDGLRRVSGRTVVECLHGIVHGEDQECVPDERFRMALGWQSPEQAEVIWRLLGLDGRLKEPVRHGVG